MTEQQDVPRVVSATREIDAAPERIFDLIADPAQQPRWDGNHNLAEAPAGQRVRRTGDMFTMTLTNNGAVRENHVVEFDEGRRIAWRPAEPGRQPPGHLWRWELEPAGASRTRVTHTYDWTRLTDEKRFQVARATSAAKLMASLDRLAALAEQTAEPIDPLAAHQRAQQVFAAVLGNVGTGQLDGPTPCPEWTVRDLVEHVIGGNERVAIRAGLETEPAARPPGLAAALLATAARAQSVFAAPDGMTRTFDLPVGPVPGSAFIRIRTTELLAHAWDLATATGQSTDLDPELATQLLSQSREHITGNMRGRYYGQPQPCDQDRPPADQLAAFLGRGISLPGPGGQGCRCSVRKVTTAVMACSSLARLVKVCPSSS